MDQPALWQEFHFYFKVVLLLYIIFFSINVLSSPIKTWQKVVWTLVIVLFPLIGAVLFHNFRHARTLQGHQRRKFNPNFLRKRTNS
jgi:hypothetical protein